MEFDPLKATILAAIQGLTEFLPVSSSAHLILPSALLGWEDQGLAFDVAVHLGTLLAVLLYFRKDLLQIAGACLHQLGKGDGTSDSRLGWMLLVATLPVIGAGFFLRDLAESHLRDVRIIAAATVIFGILLWWADRRSKGTVNLPDLPWLACLLVGLAQTLALAPGASRSGITMTAALFCNLERQAAARFSFLLSIPVIAGAAFLLGLKLLGEEGVNWLLLLYAMTVAAAVAYSCIAVFLRIIQRLGFLPFVLYRIALGGVLWLFFA